MQSAHFYRGLAALLRAGMPVREAVASMRADGTLPDPVIATVLADGGTLANALRRVPRTFPAEEVSLVQAGEETGRVDEILDRIADIREEQARAWKEFRAGCAYSIVILHFAAVFIPFGLMNSSGPPLRFAAPLAITATILAAFWGGVALLAVLASDARSRTRLMRRFEPVPALGASIRHQRQAIFASVLEAAYESGMTLDRGLELAAGASGSDTSVAAARVGQGVPLGDALRGDALLSSAAVSRLATAERAGSLGEELRRIVGEEFEASSDALERAVGVFSKGLYVVVLVGGAVYALFMISKLFGAYSGIL